MARKRRGKPPERAVITPAQRDAARFEMCKAQPAKGALARKFRCDPARRSRTLGPGQRPPPRKCTTTVRAVDAGVATSAPVGATHGADGCADAGVAGRCGHGKTQVATTIALLTAIPQPRVAITSMRRNLATPRGG